MLEDSKGALVDNSMERVAALDPQDDRAYEVKVAGPAALIVAKMHKITERLDAHIGSTIKTRTMCTEFCGQ